MKTNISLARVLETCCRLHAADALLTPGSPPLVRHYGVWRSLKSPRVLMSDVVSMAMETVGARPSAGADGYTYTDFNFGNVARFRAMAFGYPQTTLLLLVHLSADSLPESSQPIGAGPSIPGPRPRRIT